MIASIMDITDMKKTEKGEIDIETALYRLGGRRDIYIRMLNQFAPAYGGAGDAIRQSLARQDAQTAHRLAHSIKSAAAGVGLNALSEASHQLETAIARQSRNIGACFLAFANALDNALETVSGLTASTLESARNAPPPPERIAMPPAAVLESIMESALRGEFTRLDKILDALERDHPEFVEFCGAVRCHAERYDDEAIVKYVKQED